MTQVYTDDVFASNHIGFTDLQNMENNFTTLKSSFSGASAPSGPVAGQAWFDTTYKNLKIRNSTNSAWLGVMYGNSANLIWMYANTATDGWVVYGGVVDRVLAVKGGSQAYNVAGGNGAGTWDNATGVYTGTESADHAHLVSGQTATVAPHRHARGDQNYTGSMGFTVGDRDVSGYYTDYQTPGATVSAVYSSGRTAAHAHTVASYSTYRPAAAVGTLQYPA
jgi:hypothetical protein